MNVHWEDYEIVEETLDFPLAFLVKHRPSGDFFQVQMISLENFKDKERKTLLKTIRRRVQLKHPHMVQFYEPIHHRNVVYLRQEYCPNGTLQQLAKKPIHENLLYRIMYQTAFALKTLERLMGPLSPNTILLDQNYQVKLYNFSIEAEKGREKDVKMSQLGALIFQLATRKPFARATFQMDLQQAEYSEAFKALLISLIKDQSEVKKNINKILFHPQVLLHSRKWNRENGECMEALERREAALHIKEQLLKEQERQLAQREQKLLRMERALKDKLQHAEAYLQRCEEPSYVSCGDSDIFPTSSKLQVETIVKPAGFSRTLSEKRIRFKTSPLKDRNFVRKSLRQPRISEGNQESTKGRRRSLFLANECENGTGWTQATKKHAFDMLRLLNSKEKENVQHTVL